MILTCATHAVGEMISALKCCKLQQVQLTVASMLEALIHMERSTGLKEGCYNCSSHHIVHQEGPFTHPLSLRIKSHTHTHTQYVVHMSAGMD